MSEIDYHLEMKSLDDEGHIEGLAAGYGNLDLAGDVLAPGAAAKALAGRKSLPMLLYHDLKRPVGIWNGFSETPEGLAVKGRFAMSTGAGKEAYSLTKEGALAGLSIGFRTLKERFVGKARHLMEVAIHEISLCTIPINDRTLVTKVKGVIEAGELPTVREFEDFLREAGGFSKSLATTIAAKAKPHLRGEPEADELAEYLRALRAA